MLKMPHAPVEPKSQAMPFRVCTTIQELCTLYGTSFGYKPNVL